jgi:hypothetical protein
MASITVRYANGCGDSGISREGGFAAAACPMVRGVAGHPEFRCSGMSRSKDSA